MAAFVTRSGTSQPVRERSQLLNEMASPIHAQLPDRLKREILAEKVAVKSRFSARRGLGIFGDNKRVNGQNAIGVGNNRIHVDLGDYIGQFRAQHGKVGQGAGER